MKFRFFSVLLILVFGGCNVTPEQENQTTGEKAGADYRIRKDTVGEFRAVNLQERESLRQIFQAIPDEYLKTSMYDSPDSVMRNAILNKTEFATRTFRDIIADTTNRYLLYYKEYTNAGILTSLKEFPFVHKKGGLIVVDISVWKEDKIESESVFFLEKNKEGHWEDSGKRKFLPSLKLQDFFNKDTGTFIKEADHDYLPFLCFELPRENQPLKVFLGEWKHGKEHFEYTPERAFVELNWRDDKFQKTEIISGNTKK
ncbi:MAG: hypothetical protein K1X92_16895 [Bacteroidia bacterium]|nr:hypothetical protein [Bacteroidia bacterium]